MPDAEPPQEVEPTHEVEPLAAAAVPRGPTNTRDHRRRIAAIAFVAAVVLGATAVALTRSALFHARTIRIHGASHLSRADVLRISGIVSGTNVFTLDAGAAERRLERDPWIVEATIAKDLPSTIVVDVHERVAVAVAEVGGIPRLVADDGVLLEAALPRVAAGLPRIAAAEQDGPEPTIEAVDGAARALAAMAPTLRRRVDLVSILADGQLLVGLSSGAQVAYGAAVDLVEKARALRAVLDWAAAHATSVTSADVRVPSAPTAVLSGGAVAAP